MAKTYAWPKGQAPGKHTISYAQHQKNVKGKGGGTTASPSGGAGATLTAERVTARARKDPDFLARARRDVGGLRHLLADDLLPKNLRASRELTTRLNSPITEGSAITGRDLAHQAQAATTVQYGPQETDLAQQLKEQQTRQQQISGPGGWYDQYLAQVAGNASQVGAINDKAQQQIAALGQGQQNLGAQTLQSVTQGTLAATGAPPPAGTTLPSDIAQTSAQATSARQQMIDNLAAQQAGVGANAQNYAQNFAGLVAPQQKIEAGLGQARNVDKVRAAQQKLKGEEGAYNIKWRTEKTQQEATNALARQTLGLNAAKTAAEIKASDPKNVLATATAKGQLQVDQANATRAGVGLKTWQSMSTKQQQKLLDDAANRGKTKGTSKYHQRITDPSSPFIGMTPAEVAGLSRSHRERLISDAYKLTHPTKPPKPGANDPTDPTSNAAFKAKYGVNPNTANQHREFRDQVASVSSWIGKLGGDRNALSSLLVSGGEVPNPADKKNPVKVPKFSQTAVRAALDMKFLRGLSGGTVSILHRAGYKNTVLGYPMAPAQGGGSTYANPPRPAITGSRGDTGR